MKNEVIFDGFVYGDPKVYAKLITFNVNATTHSKKLEDGTYKNSYTSIKVNYFGEQSKELLAYLKKGAAIRVIAKLDTESYKNKDGKTIYNIILISNKIFKISFEKETKDGKEVTIVKEENLV